MKTDIKCENTEFLVITHNHVPILLAMQIPIQHQNCLQYLMKTATKHENDDFLAMPLKHVSGLMGHANRPRTPKPWAIAHESGYKTRKRRVFSHNSQTCIMSYGP